MAQNLEAGVDTAASMFADRLADAVDRKRSQLLVGLDPRVGGRGYFVPCRTIIVGTVQLDPEMTQVEGGVEGPVAPVALNSGLYWPRRSLMRLR